MGDLDDAPEQKPLNIEEVENVVLDLLPKKHYDLIITHNPLGEYTRHRRHEETGKAVVKLWREGKINTNELWLFAYEDGDGKYHPRPVENTSIYIMLSEQNRQRKYGLITETYGFENNSWEALSVTKSESFWKFTNPDEAEKWFNNKGIVI